LGIRGAAGAELFEYVGVVGGEGGLVDVVRFGDLLAAVPELGCGALGVRLLVDKRGDGFAEGVRGRAIA
jgi:hypothetical protein